MDPRNNCLAGPIFGDAYPGCTQGPVKIIRTVACTESPWILSKRVIYENSIGETLEWDYIERTNARQTVVVMARFRNSGDLLLIRQYRVIFDRYVIGLPAGIVGEEDVEACALRELLEETGYAGEVVQVSPPLTSNSALIRELSQCVIVEIPEDAVAQGQELEPSEIIEVHRVKRDGLQAFFRHAIERGDLIGAGLWYLLAASEYF